LKTQEVNTVEEINNITALTPKTTDDLMLEVFLPLPEESKLLILGVARGIALSASIPVAG
jgi:hypothetical protein